MLHLQISSLYGSFITMPETDCKHKGELNVLTYNVNIVKKNDENK